VPATGCKTGSDWSLTHRLWNNGAFEHFNQPASDPRLQLFANERHSDVLVLYDETQEKSGQIVRRAFFVNPNMDRIREGRKPHFVGTNAAHRLTPIPVINSGSGDAIPTEGLCLVISTNQSEFSLYSNAQEIGTLALPTYTTAGGIQKTLLTPLAVTGDTLLVASVVGVFAAYAAAQRGVAISTGR